MKRGSLGRGRFSSTKRSVEFVTTFVEHRFGQIRLEPVVRRDARAFRPRLALAGVWENQLTSTPELRTPITPGSPPGSWPNRIKNWSPLDGLDPLRAGGEHDEPIETKRGATRVRHIGEGR
jgi:hypothetical protein